MLYMVIVTAMITATMAKYPISRGKVRGSDESRILLDDIALHLSCLANHVTSGFIGISHAVGLTTPHRGPLRHVGAWPLVRAFTFQGAGQVCLACYALFAG